MNKLLYKISESKILSYTFGSDEKTLEQQIAEWTAKGFQPLCLPTADALGLMLQRVVRYEKRFQFGALKLFFSRKR